MSEARRATDEVPWRDSAARRQFLADMARDALALEDLKQREGDCRVARLAGDGHGGDGHGLVIKLWRRTGGRALLRRITRSTPAQREYRALVRLREAGVAAPEPYGLERISHAKLPYTEALFLEDLGPCERAMTFYQGLIAQGRSAAAATLLDDIVDLTVGVIDAGIVDTDHSFNNIVVPASGRPVRLDLEIARERGARGASDRELGEMIGRLIATLIFTLQPDTAAADPFLSKLRDRLSLSPATLDNAKAFVNRMLDDQREKRGVDTRVELTWHGEA